MKIAHVLRKYVPSEWGGTESAVREQMKGLRAGGVESIVFCPHSPGIPEASLREDPFRSAGFDVKRFKAYLPYTGLSPAQRTRMWAVGGNLLSLHAFWQLLREPNVDLVHTHTLGRIGGIARTVARIRKLPCVLTIHGGLLDLPPAAHQSFAEMSAGGKDWGKVFGLLVRSRKVVDDADVVICVNDQETRLLSKKIPAKTCLTLQHGIPVEECLKDFRNECFRRLPFLAGKTVLCTRKGCMECVLDSSQGQWVVQEHHEWAEASFS